MRALTDSGEHSGEHSGETETEEGGASQTIRLAPPPRRYDAPRRLVVPLAVIPATLLILNERIPAAASALLA